jgi:hypothetical protein
MEEGIGRICRSYLSNKPPHPRRPDMWTAVFRVFKRLVLLDWCSWVGVNYTASQPRMPVPRSETLADPLDVFPAVMYETPQEPWLAAIFMHHLPPFCKCLYPQERCIDKQQTVACCHNITSRQPVYCSRCNRFHVWLLWFYLWSPLPWRMDILCVYSQREYREFIANRQGAKQDVRTGNASYVPEPV